VEAVLARCFLDELPERLIGDKAYDADALDQTLAEEYGIEMISPNRSNRKRKTQDGRPLRRYRRRWKVERIFAWMQNYRRLVTRWEYHIENFLGFVQLACLLCYSDIYEMASSICKRRCRQNGFLISVKSPSI
jgi:transposase